MLITLSILNYCDALLTPIEYNTHYREILSIVVEIEKKIIKEDENEKKNTNPFALNIFTSENPCSMGDTCCTFSYTHSLHTYNHLRIVC